MVTVTFASRPSPPVLPEPASKAAPDAKGQGHDELFTLLQPDPGPSDRAPAKRETQDAGGSPPDVPATETSPDQKEDDPEAVIADGGLLAQPDRPAPFQTLGQTVVDETLPDAALPPNAAFAGPQGVPVPEPPIGATAPSPPVEPEAAEGSDQIVLTLGHAVDHTGAEARSALPPGVPAFWAAREAADPDMASPEEPGTAPAVTGPIDSADPKPVDLVPTEGDAAPAESEEAPLQRDPKAAATPALPQTLSAAPIQASPTPVTTQTTVPATLPPQVPAQIAVALASRPERPLELRLAPVELGGLTVNLRQDGEILRVVVQADRPDTLDLLRRNGDILLEELRLAGFSGAALSFSDGGGGAQERSAAAQACSGPNADLPKTPPPQQASFPAQTAQGLDLRL